MVMTVHDDEDHGDDVDSGKEVIMRIADKNVAKDDDEDDDISLLTLYAIEDVENSVIDALQAVLNRHSLHPKSETSRNSQSEIEQRDKDDVFTKKATVIAGLR